LNLFFRILIFQDEALEFIRTKSKIRVWDYVKHSDMLLDSEDECVYNLNHWN